MPLLLLTGWLLAFAGLAFAGVHDSFWTHAADVPAMNRILREQFVAMHSQPLLEQLRDHLVKTFPEAELPEVPPTGDLDLNEVLESKYFFN